VELRAEVMLEGDPSDALDALITRLSLAASLRSVS
jgi:hypothetical protein